MMTQTLHSSSRVRTFRCVIGYISLLLSSLNVFATAGESFNISSTACNAQTIDDVRIVQVIYENEASPIPCKVMYEKSGVLQELASARNTVGFCEKTERQVVRNLVKAGWQCEHSLSGIGIEPDNSLVLDLFFDHSPVSSIDPSADLAQSKSPQTQQQLTAIFNEKYRQALQEQLASDLQRELGVELQVDVDLDAEFNLSGPAAPSDASGARDLDPDYRTALSMPRYALVSQTVDTEQQAHKLKAEFKRLYPGVTTRVGRFGIGSEAVYRVVLGAADARDKLAEVLQFFDPAVQQQFHFMDNNGSADPIVYVPDDWPRYTIALCLADGHSTVAELASCSGFELEFSTLLSCLGGGTCVPVAADSLAPVSAYPAVDLLDAMSSQELVAVARDRLRGEVSKCNSLADPTDAQLAECAALALLDPEQRDVVECHSLFPSVSQMLDCAGGARLSAVVTLYERCAVSQIANLQCLLEMTDNQFVDVTATCLEQDTRESIARCVVLANVDTNEQKVYACLKQASSVNARASCIASQHLEPHQSALLECADGSPSIGNFGICTARALRVGTDAQWLVASCLMNSELPSIQLPSCAGGRFAGSELTQCLAEGVLLSSCYGPDTLLTDIVHNIDDRYMSTGEVDRKIAAFREELYAAEGGDLSVVLANPVNSQWLNTEVKGNESIPRSRNEQRSGFQRFGVDK